MNQSLRETLDLLHQQLVDAENIDEDLAERLRTTIREVQSALEKTDEPHEGDPRQSAWLTETAENFEQSHPTIAGTISRLVDILGQAGI